MLSKLARTSVLLSGVAAVVLAGSGSDEPNASGTAAARTHVGTAEGTDAFVAVAFEGS